MKLLTAPTSLGNRPYETDGTARWTSLGPGRLRERGLVERLRAHDLGDVPAAPYRDFVRPLGGVRNEDLVLQHVRAIAKALQRSDDFTVIIGGDCSVLLGSLLGLKRGRDIGLVFIDGHDDFNTEATSETGGVAGMDLALAIGRGKSPLARLDPSGPLVREENVIALGIREGDFHGAPIRTEVSVPQLPFFIHVDADVLDPQFMPFVDSPVAGGWTPEQLVDVLRPLVENPNALGLELTIYDPRDDTDARGSELLVDILERVLGTIIPAGGVKTRTRAGS